MSMRARALPTIYTYEDIDKYFNATKPISRGKGTGIVPLGKRADWSLLQLRKRDNGDYLCYFHSTPVLTVSKVGERTRLAINVMGWHTPTTRDVLNSLVGRLWFSLVGRQLRASTRSGKSYFVPDTGELIMMTDNYISEPEPANPEPCVIHKVNRAKSNQVRMQYIPALKYIKGMLKLKGEPGSDWVQFECAEAERTRGMGIVEHLASDNPEDHYHALLGVAFIVGHRSYTQNLIHASKTQITNELNRLILKHHAQEVLERVELPIGEVATDKYKGWL